MKYSDEQIKALKELRKRFFECGFTIFNLKKRHRKHEMEFAAAEVLKGSFSSAVVRLYRGKVRIRFFEVEDPLPTITKKYLLIGSPASLIVWDSRPLNPTLKGNKHFWGVFCYRKERFEENALRILERAGIHIQKGISSSQAVS